MQFRLLALPIVLALSACSASAKFAVPGYELVYTAPVETSLAASDLRDPVAVWSELFDGAKSEIDIGQFYAVSQKGARFEKVIERLEAAGKRGVKIRFLMESRGQRMSDPALIERLKAIPGLEFKILDFTALAGNGIIHAKYLVVDGKSAFVGSQNFDWRAFEHIHETGLLITDTAVVNGVKAIFERDWAGRAPDGTAVTPLDTVARAQLLASPPNMLVPEVAASEPALVSLLASAKSEVRIQVLDYTPLAFAPGMRPYYPVIETAMRTAAARGVKIKLLVSHWNTEQPGIFWLKSLALVPNIEVRIATLPPASVGPIPFARVNHSKFMVIDGETSWVGTSNWAGGYFDTSRNMEVLVRDKVLAARIDVLHEQLWSSSYTAPIDVTRDYPRPDKAATGGKTAE